MDGNNAGFADEPLKSIANVFGRWINVSPSEGLEALALPLDLSVRAAGSCAIDVRSPESASTKKTN